MKAFGYLRLSRDRDTSTSIDKQRASVASHCEQHGWEIVDWFEDVDVSGGKHSRPGLDAMLARLDEVDRVVVHRLDRVMRSVIGFAKLIERLQAAGVDIVSVTESFDTSTTMGRGMMWIGQVFAQIERENTRDRIVATQEHLARLGRPAFGARAFGRDEDPFTREWIVVEDEAQIIRELAALCLAGMGLQPMCDGLNDGSLFGRPIPTVRGNAWHPTALSRVLQSPRLVGYQIRHGEPLTDEPTLPAVLDVETFDAVRAELARRRVFKQRHGESNGELTGLVRCHTCEGRMYINSTAGKRGYTCRNRSGHGCRIPKDFLEAEVARQLFEWIDDQKLLAVQQDARPEPDDDPRLRAALSRLEWGREELMRDYYQEGRIGREAFEVQLAEATDRIERLREKLAIDESAGRRAVDRILTREDIADEWQYMTPGEKRTIFAACVQVVWVHPAAFKGQKPTSDRVKVRWTPKHR